MNDWHQSFYILDGRLLLPQQPPQAREGLPPGMRRMRILLLSGARWSISSEVRLKYCSLPRKCNMECRDTSQSGNQAIGRKCCLECLDTSQCGNQAIGLSYHNCLQPATQPGGRDLTMQCMSERHMHEAICPPQEGSAAPRVDAKMTCLLTHEYEQSAVPCRAAKATCSSDPGDAGTLLLMSQLHFEMYPRSGA